MPVLQQLEPIIDAILTKTINIQQGFNNLFDKCLEVTENFDDASAIYQCSIAMLDKTNMTANEYEALFNNHIGVAIERITEYKQNNKLSGKIIKKIEKQAFMTKQPKGTVQFQGMLKSVLLDNKMAVLTPYIDIDEAHNASALQSAWAMPNEDTILKAGYLVVYGKKFPEAKGKLFNDYSIINDSTIGLTPANFSHLINKLHEQILKIDGEKQGFNFFEDLIQHLAVHEIGETIFLQKLKEYANFKQIKLSVTTIKEAIQLILSCKKKYDASLGIQIIDDSIDINIGLELLYPFAPVLQASWLARRQDYAFIDGVLLYKTNTFVSPITKKPVINAKFKIMVAGTITYILCSDNRSNNYIASMSDSGHSTSLYALKIKNLKTNDVSHTTIDKLLAKKSNDFFKSGEIYRIDASTQNISLGLPYNTTYSSDIDIIPSTQLHDTVEAFDVVAVQKAENNKDVLGWGKYINQETFAKIIPYLKVIHGQNLTVTSKNHSILFKVYGQPINDEGTTKLIQSLGKSIIAHNIKGLKNFLVDN